MKTKNKWLLGGLITAGAGYGLYRIFRSEKKKVDQTYERQDNELRDLGIKDPIKDEEEDDGIEDKSNITARTFLRIIRNVDPDGDNSSFSWDSDWLNTDYYKSPDNWAYNQRSVHIIQNFEGMNNTVTVMCQIPPTNFKESSITAGDYIRSIKSELRELVGELYPQRIDLEICGYYEKLNEESVYEYHKIPEEDYLKYGEYDGLSRFISKLYENDRKLLKKTQYSSADMFLRYTFPILGDGEDCTRILKILKALFMLEIESKVGNDVDQFDTLVFHRNYLSWIYEWKKEEGSFREFEYGE